MATLIVGLMAGFHNHVHAGTLLIVPMLAALARRREPDALPPLFAILVLAPTFSMFCTLSVPYAALMMIGLMLCIHGTLLVEFWSDPRAIDRSEDCAGNAGMTPGTAAASRPNLGWLGSSPRDDAASGSRTGEAVR